MTSVNSGRKLTMTSSLDRYENGGCYDEREGIFDQFAEDQAPELYFYTVHSSSDSEGNITLHDVTRKQFHSDVRLMSEREGTDDEDEDDKTKSNISTKKRYGFRTRRLKRHRDDEFDTSLCGNSTDESGDEGSKYIPSSDDEPYDIAADNWSFVRGAKKKGLDGAKKKADSPKKTLRVVAQKRTPLRIRLKAAFGRKKRGKFSRFGYSFKKRNECAQPKKAPPKGERASKEQTLSQDATKSVAASIGKMEVMKSISAASPFSKKILSRIRCGYNPHAPKISEIRHIRRRQLRQTPSRIAASESSSFNDGSSSSSDENSGKSPQIIERGFLDRSRDHFKQGRKSSRTNTTKTPSEPPGHPDRSSGEVEAATPSGDETKTPDGSTTVTSSGLKLVIRRQSLERNNSTPSVNCSPKPNDEKPKAPIAGVKKLQILKTVKLRPVEIFGRMEPTVVLTKTPLIEERSGENGVDKTENKDLKKEEERSSLSTTTDKSLSEDSPSSPGVTPQSATGDVNEGSPSVGNKPTEDEATRRKKAKKKRKKDRGRLASAAGTEDDFDAQHTAMRLAMELPRHNWLVKHLIKENKLKAEDDKPLNNVPEHEGTNGQTNTETTANSTPQTTNLPDVPKSEDSSQQQTEVSDATKPEEKEDTSHRMEETQPEESFKHSNNIKGSFMVGIVKPFQHLKMSPVRAETAEMSPPPLCIVDEEEGASSERQHNSLNTEPSSGVPSSAVDEKPSETCKNMDNFNAICLKKGSDLSEAPVTLTSRHKSVITTGGVVANCTQGVLTHTSSVTTHVTETKTSQDAKHAALHSKMNPIPQDAKGQPPQGHSNTSSSDCKNSETTMMISKSESNVKISNCHSLLALDLSKSSTKEETTCDQPLDLSMGSKTGGISPKILDLSVKTTTKKPPIKEGTVSLKKTPPTTHTPSPTPNVTQEFFPKKNSDVILIVDDETVHSNKQGQTGSIQTDINQRPSPPGESTRLEQSRMETSNCATPPVKRCASYDSVPPQASLEASGHKRTRDGRMSLDDTKRMRTEEPVPTALNRPREVLVPADLGTLAEKARKEIWGESSPVIQRPRQNTPSENKSLTDLLLTKKPQPVMNLHEKQTAAAAPTNGTRPPSHPLRKTPPTPTPVQLPSRGIAAQNNKFIPVGTVPDFNNNNINSIHMKSSPKTPLSNGDQCFAPHRMARHKSLEYSNSAAHMVAQAYHQPDIRQLEPYIKQQQMVVDQKIQELEAIKQQLANARQLGVKVITPPPYPQPSRQSQLHALPVPRPLPSSQTPQPVRTHTSPPTKLLPRYPSQASPSLVRSFPRPAIHQSTPVHPGLPSNRIVPTPVNQGQPRPPRTVPTPSYQLMPPLHEQVVQQTHPAFRRSVSNGGHLLPVNQTMIHQPHRPRAFPVPANHQIVTRPATTPTHHFQANRVPVVVPQRQVHQSEIVRMMNCPALPPQIPATAPTVYRNGGLTVRDSFKTKLNEPIVIEDDVVPNSGLRPRKRSAPEPVPDPLKVRRSYSFHPPLSKNRMEVNFQPGTQWNGAQMPAFSAPQQPAEAPKSEVCVKCRGKAFFLCSGCRKMWYCSKDCQLKDWSTHSKKCGA